MLPVKRIEIKEQSGITGGAAKNIGVVKMVEKELEISATAMKLAPKSLPPWEPPSSHRTSCEIYPMPNEPSDFIPARNSYSRESGGPWPELS